MWGVWVGGLALGMHPDGTGLKVMGIISEMLMNSQWTLMVICGRTTMMTRWQPAATSLAEGGTAISVPTAQGHGRLTSA